MRRFICQRIAERIGQMFTMALGIILALLQLPQTTQKFLRVPEVLIGLKSFCRQQTVEQHGLMRTWETLGLSFRCQLVTQMFLQADMDRAFISHPIMEVHGWGMSMD